MVTDEQSNTLVYSFSDYDFDAYRYIQVYCLVTDANGNVVSTQITEVFPYIPFAVSSSPKDYYMQSSMEETVT